VIDAASIPSSLLQVFREEGIPVEAIEPIGDKVLRTHRATPYLERGQVWLPGGDELQGIPPPSWTSQIVDQCADFPDAEFDDIHDTVTQAINWARPHLDRPVERVRPNRQKRKKERGSEITKGYG